MISLPAPRQNGLLNRTPSRHPSVAKLWSDFERIVTADKSNAFWLARIVSLGV